MAVGTAASRITGQVRTILLAAALGTTGMAADAYQAGSQIPQVIFTLVSGGIFNAVLVPQIVRTLKKKDAQDRLNKLVTLAIALLLGVTLLVALLTPPLTRLYVNGDHDMLALATSFTFWCVPQIFFYGLYTVLGQILAAKDRFGTYAWSSVGANVISCIGFTAFILMFGRANRQPLSFWTSGKIALTAGMWTLGVAFQALVLFLPLRKIGLHYRPSWGIHGFGLRSMGSVAAWGIGIVVVDQLQTIVNQRVLTSVPGKAAQLRLNVLDMAGNASYWNANTIYILPYSLIATSVATAMFPKISQAIADHDLDGAREDLSGSLRNVWLMMCLFTVMFIVIPTPITLALLPSVSVKEAVLMAGPLAALSIGLPFSSTYLIIQRTFYAFEDGYHPFFFTLLVSGGQALMIVIAILFISPFNWATTVGVTMSLSFILAFPVIITMMRKRFQGRLDGKRIATAFGKGIIASLVAAAVGWLLRYPVYGLFGADIEPGSGVRGGHMNWLQAVGVCCVLGIIVTLLYVGTLWVLRTQELMPIARSLAGRFGIKLPGNDGTGSQGNGYQGNGHDTSDTEEKDSQTAGDKFPFGTGHPRHYDPIGFNPLDSGTTDDDVDRENLKVDAETGNGPEPASASHETEPAAAAPESQKPNQFPVVEISDDLTFASVSAISPLGETADTELPPLPIEPVNSADTSYGDRSAQQIKPLFDLGDASSHQNGAEIETDGDDAQSGNPTESGLERPTSAADFSWLTAASLGLPPVAADDAMALERQVGKAARHRAR
ncbi:murein biosynthesis integral membrane protein MurJ [Bifidobacterium sp. ESL0764]|uniref:murein biosynthesis integral membrane protein MurJ n=1 Tax=Bifidobacterium sp. ESL0764 TaxID=2983228 RepID=UPI0023F8F140|nr:murein biosynthesis integral membrane protein MurJ [Bifidobacterium sp. ESL0764]WEV65848.1 murein biosynthesis integral membrane protein MurJ [Bifidobacterium sp. ESL0764]